MRNYMGWAVRRVESRATAPRFQVGTIREEDTRWEWGPYGDRQDSLLALFRLGIDEAMANRMIDEAEVNPENAIRFMLGSDEIVMV